MNPEERAVESQRWSLITSGVDRKDISIFKNRIYIKHKLFGIVKGSRLVRQSEETTEPFASHQEQSADENEDSQNSGTSTPNFVDHSLSYPLN